MHYIDAPTPPRQSKAPGEAAPYHPDARHPRSVLALRVSDHPGVLTKVSTLFSRRGCNIHALTVAPAGQPRYARITVTVAEPPERLLQLLAQLQKLEDVKEVTLLPSPARVPGPAQARPAP